MTRSEKYEPEDRDLLRALLGEAAPEERARINNWREAAPENQRRFAALARLWRNTGEALRKDTPRIDIARGWADLRARMPVEDAPSDAAPIAFPERQRFGQRSRHPAVWLLAAVALLSFGAWLMRAPLFQGGQSESGMNYVEAAHGKRSTIDLADGSRVILRAGASLSWPKRFGDPREVELTGQAFFEVAEDPGSPFVVATANARITVLGTSFDVDQRAGLTRLSVISGRVAFAGRDNAASVELGPGQASICMGSSPPSPPQQIDVDRVAAWRNGRLIFDRTPLGDIAALLEREFDVVIRVEDPELARQTVSGAFDRAPIEMILEELALTLGFRYEVHNHGFLILPTEN
jgi:ferric-dicitrate binding protein FerR (iron transport regulator)